ncbi:MAG: glycosyltransferase, partial [Myxococcota bacterium]|nr:glycosyltransferase [Myxococcota bacterium]
ARLRLRLLGGEGALAGRIRAAGLEDVVRLEPGVPRARLAAELAAAPGAVVLAPEGPRGPEPIPGKLFDAAGAGRPVLALSAPGPLPELVVRSGLGRVVDPADAAGLRAELRDAMGRAARGGLAGPLSPEGVAGLAAPRRMTRLVDTCRELLAARELPCPSPSAS